MSKLKGGDPVVHDVHRGIWYIYGSYIVYGEILVLKVIHPNGNMIEDLESAFRKPTKLELALK